MSFAEFDNAPVSALSSARVDRREPTPWASGLFVATTCAIYCSLLLVGLYTLVADITPWSVAARWIGVAVAVLVAGGLGWTLWPLRDRPVWRWIVWGSMIGFLAGVGSSIALALLNP